MSALPPLNRGGEGSRPRVEIWSKQIGFAQSTGSRSQERSLDHRRWEQPEIEMVATAVARPRRTPEPAAAEQADAFGGVSIAAVRSMVPPMAVELRVGYGRPVSSVSLELMPAREVMTDVATTAEPALATGKAHRFAADFYSRATAVGYPGRSGTVGGRLDVRV